METIPSPHIKSATVELAKYLCQWTFKSDVSVEALLPRLQRAFGQTLLADATFGRTLNNFKSSTASPKKVLTTFNQMENTLDRIVADLEIFTDPKRQQEARADNTEEIEALTPEVIKTELIFIVEERDFLSALNLLVVGMKSLPDIDKWEDSSIYVRLKWHKIPLTKLESDSVHSILEILTHEIAAEVLCVMNGETAFESCTLYSSIQDKFEESQ